MTVKLTLYDKLLITFILALSLITFLFNFTLDAQGEQKYMVISVDNRFVMEISFNDQTERTINFPFGKDNEHTATLEISRGRVRMLPLPKELCPRGICSHTGWIRYDYQSIVCVPNRIMIFFSGGKTPEVDGVTY